MQFLILIPILILIIFLYFRRRKATKIKVISQTYEDLIPEKTTYELREFVQLNQEELHSNYDSIYLVHGTFVGNDPFDLISLLEKAFPNLQTTIIEKIKQQFKSGQDYLMKDFGNFHKNITTTIKENINDSSEIHFFNWSSSNHHYARLKGTLELIKDISSKHKQSQKIILFGHSHAGQIFALLTLLLNNQLISNQIFQVLNLEKDNEKELRNSLKLLKTMKLDFVTLGTPVRYPWCLNKNMNLLHIINHRGTLPQGGSLSSSITSKHGDYIQQWAVAGSDNSSPNIHDREINMELDLILGRGSDMELLKRNIKFKKRLHHAGHHLLVDFKDYTGPPNLLKTIFGHAIYTQKSSMDWILKQSILYFNSLNKKD